jgi:hypothetical protein
MVQHGAQTLEALMFPVHHSSERVVTRVTSKLDEFLFKKIILYTR